MSVHYGGRGPGHLSRYPLAASTTPPASEQYRMAGTRFREATATATVSATNYYQCLDFSYGSPPWATRDMYFFFPTYYNTLGGGTHETAITSKIVVTGVSFFVSGSWQTGTVVDGPVTIDPAVDTVGKWVKVTTTFDVPADVLQRMRWTATLDAGMTAPVAATSYGNDKGQGFTTDAAAYLTNGTALTNASAVRWFPTHMMCKGSDGREAFLLLTDSIGFGVDQATAPLSCTARNEIGYLAIGLDDNATSQRLTYSHFGVAGQNAANYGDNTKVGKKLAVMEQAVALNGGLPVVTGIISAHIHNDTAANLSALLTIFRTMYSVWRTACGDAALPVYQVEATPGTTTSDNWATSANQTPTAAKVYPTGLQWQFNNAVGGADGLGDASATLRADGSIQGSIGIWRYCCEDVSTARDRWKVQSFNTTLAADWSSGNPSLNASPPVGSYLSFGAKQEAAWVQSVSGSGPYTATVTITSGAISPTITTGGNVRACSSFDGTHPGPYSHNVDMPVGVVDFKIEQGWI